MTNRQCSFDNYLQELINCKHNTERLYKRLSELCCEIANIPIPEPSKDKLNSSYIDITSTSYIPNDFLKDYVAIKTSPNGNCFYNSVSVLLVNTENMAIELRVRTILSIFCLLVQCINQNSVKKDVVKHMKTYIGFSGQVYNIRTNQISDNDIKTFLHTELLHTIDDNSWAGMTQIQSMSNAICCPIWSVYPNANWLIRDKFNVIIQPWTNNNINAWILPILWSGYYINNDWFVGNHFVPLLCTGRLLTNPLYDGTTDLLGKLPSPTLVHTTTPQLPQLLPTYSIKEDCDGPLSSINKCSADYSAFQCIKRLPKLYCDTCQQMILCLSPKYINRPQCSYCYRFIKRQGYSPLDSSYVHPGPIPYELTKLSDTEIQMLSMVHPYMKLLKLPAGGQFAQRGQCINFPVNIQTVCSVLPRLPSFDTKILVHNARKSGKPSIIDINNLYSGLKWLITNNKLYSTVSIDNVFPDLYQSLQHIVNGEVNKVKEETESAHEKVETTGNMDGKCTYSELGEQSSKSVENDASSCPSPSKKKCDVDVSADILSEVSMIPNDYIIPNDKSIECTLPWIKTNPINIFEYKTAEEMSFPKLFPKGSHGFKAMDIHNLTMKQYFNCRFLNKDDRWSTCTSYLFWSLYMYEQHSLQSQISIALRTRNAAANLTACDILQNKYKHKVAEDYKFMKTMKGTAAYWREQLQNLMAKIRILGPPIFFLSLSSNDMAWVEMFKFIDPDLPDNILPILSSTAKTNMIRAHPIKTAIYFSRRWEAYLRDILLSVNSPLGKVTDHFARVEFQNRGSPHIHAFFWVANAPDMESMEGRQRAAAFIDKYIKATVPSDNEHLYNLVSSLQTHNHTFNCQRSRRSASCRYDFPREICPNTKVQVSNISSTTGRFYQLKRDKNSRWVNPYNEQILTEWNANMDIQIVGCKYAAAVYVCTYVCKNEPNSLKTAISSAIKSLPAYVSDRRKLSKIGNVLLTHRVISAQEAAYRILNLNMVYSSRTTVYVPSLKPEDQHKILKPKHQLESLPSSSENIYVEGLHSKYTRRPDNELFNTMSLVQFATSYTFCTSRPKSKLETYRLQGEPETWIKQRGKVACFRSYIPDSTKEKAKFCYAMLCLFLPWRNPTDIIHPFKSAEEAYIAKENLLDKRSIEMYSLTNKLLASLQMIRTLSEETQTDIHCTVAPAFMSNDLDDKDKGVQDIDSVFTFTDTTPNESTNTECAAINSEEFKSLAVYRYTNEEYNKRMNSLSADQGIIIQHVEETLKTHTPLYLFVSGGAGTGKSYLLQTLREHLLRNSASDYPNVVVAAPTGIAAFNVKGWTLHRLLNLDVQHRNNAPYIPLSAKTLGKLRELFQSVKYLIIDEISMVSVHMLIQIHKRLSEVKNTSLQPDVYFGNISIIAFGDLYQLKPVFGKFIFDAHEDLNMCHIWKDLFEYHELHTNYRQQGDEVYIGLLNRARVGKLTANDISLINSRRFNQNDIANTIQRVLPKKVTCKMFNETQTKATIKGQIYTIIAEDDPSNTDISTDDSDCGGLHKELEIGIGSRVMLLRNIFTKHGLVNGAQGKVVDILFTNDNLTTRNENPSTIMVLFDDKTVGDVFDDNSHSPVAIKPITVTFFSSNKTPINRTQFPLCVSFAVTVHKIQGITLPSAAIDIGPDVFTGGMAYVALSRVSSLSNLYITNFVPTKIYSSTTVHEEMERLRTRQINVSNTA